ncbi:MAG TPA: ester cyclase [Dehalococcoidia bacterium]|nr:ester cyclase [Dehalococcoidia bacterium]
MGEQDLIKVAKGAVEAFNKDDLNRASALLGTGVYNEVGTGRQLRGEAQILPALQGWRKAMPDVKGTVTNAFASGNKAVLEVTWEGTQTGPMDGPGGTLPPSGKRQTTPAAWVFEFEGDNIKESRQYFDMMSFMQQIGAIPQP